VLVVNPIPSEQEAEPNELLGFLLNLYREQHPKGSALDPTLQERYVRTADSRRKYWVIDRFRDRRERDLSDPAPCRI